MNKDYNIKQVSTLLKVSTRTIYNKIRKKELDYYKKKNKLFFPVDQFQKQKASPSQNLEKNQEAQSDEAIKEKGEKIKGLQEIKNENERLKERLRSFESIVKEKDERIEEIKQDKRDLKDQLQKQTELARNEQVLRKDFQDKFLLLGSGGNTVYDVKDSPVQTVKKTRKPKKKHKNKSNSTKKVTKKKVEEETEGEGLKSHSKSDKINNTKHRKGIWSWLIGSD